VFFAANQAKGLPESEKYSREGRQQNRNTSENGKREKMARLKNQKDKRKKGRQDAIHP